MRIIEEGDYHKFDNIAFDQVRQKRIRLTARQGLRPKCRKSIMARVCTIYCRCCTTSETLTWINTKGLLHTYTGVVWQWDLSIKVRYDGKRRQKSKELGTYHTIKVIPDLVVGNVFKDGDKMKIWVSDDANKLPSWSKVRWRLDRLRPY